MNKRVLIALGVLAVGVLIAAAPNYNSFVQRVEHIGIPVDTANCARADWTTVGDGGVLARADGGLPAADQSYVCFSRGSGACIKQGSQPTSCNFTLPLPADQLTPPLAFLREADGGLPVVRGVSQSGTANVECCPVIPSVMQGR